jgi:hypothetical protein
MGMLGGFAEGFKTVNRQVFIDTFTNYFYTKYYGGHSSAGRAIHPDLFSALVSMHKATQAGASLPPEQKRHLFSQALQYEQEVTVAPGVQAEVEKFDCPILRFLCLRPLVRFAYFPAGSYLWFKNFADKNERIAKAMRSYALAERTGWSRVETAMRSSTLLEPAYWRNPTEYIAQLR